MHVMPGLWVYGYNAVDYEREVETEAWQCNFLPLCRCTCKMVRNSSTFSTHTTKRIKLKTITLNIKYAWVIQTYTVPTELLEWYTLFCIFNVYPYIWKSEIHFPSHQAPIPKLSLIWHTTTTLVMHQPSMLLCESTLFVWLRRQKSRPVTLVFIPKKMINLRINAVRELSYVLLPCTKI